MNCETCVIFYIVFIASWIYYVAYFSGSWDNWNYPFSWWEKFIIIFLPPIGYGIIKGIRLYRFGERLN